MNAAVREAKQPFLCVEQIFRLNLSSWNRVGVTISFQSLMPSVMGKQ